MKIKLFAAFVCFVFFAAAPTISYAQKQEDHLVFPIKFSKNLLSADNDKIQAKLTASEPRQEQNLKFQNEMYEKKAEGKNNLSVTDQYLFLFFILNDGLTDKESVKTFSKIAYQSLKIQTENRQKNTVDTKSFPPTEILMNLFAALNPDLKTAETDMEGVCKKYQISCETQKDKCSICNALKTVLASLKYQSSPKQTLQGTRDLKEQLTKRYIELQDELSSSDKISTICEEKKILQKIVCMIMHTELVKTSNLQKKQITEKLAELQEDYERLEALDRMNHLAPITFYEAELEQVKLKIEQIRILQNPNDKETNNREIQLCMRQAELEKLIQDAEEE